LTLPDEAEVRTDWRTQRGVERLVKAFARGSAGRSSLARPVDGGEGVKLLAS